MKGSLHLSNPDGGGIIHLSAQIDAFPLTSQSLQAGSSGRGEGHTRCLIARSGCRACRAPRVLAGIWEDEEMQSGQKVGNMMEVISHTNKSFYSS